MTLRRSLPWIVLAAVVGFVVWKLQSAHFDWAAFGRSLRGVNPWMLLLAVGAIYANNVFRAARWAIFLRPARLAAGLPPARWTSLIGSQFIGFAGLAIFGRVGEFIRPILIARRTGIGVATQIAILTVERVFDLAAFALLFAANLLLAPQLQGLPYLHRAAYTIAGLTVALCAFVVAVRFGGGGVAWVARAVAGVGVEAKILAFRDGLRVLSGPGDFALVSLLSLGLWVDVAAAYVLVIKAFPAPVHGLTVAQVLVMMGFSVAGSALPVPSGSGAWAGNTFALANLFRIPAEAAAGAGLLVWMVTTLAIVPAGLVFARVEGVSLGEGVGRGERGE